MCRSKWFERIMSSIDIVLQLCCTVCTYDDSIAPIGTEIECDDWLVFKTDNKLLDENIDTTNIKTGAILVASKESGPGVSAEKTKQH